MSTEHDFLDNLANHQHQKMLREISNDDLTPKREKFIKKVKFSLMRAILNHFTSKMIDENGWWQDPIKDEECILICLQNALVELIKSI